MWCNFARFERGCSVRTWFYTLARHAACRLLRAPRHKHPHLDERALQELVAEVRSSSMAHLRTTMQQKVASILGSLSSDDRTLLVLRIDRGMSWAEIAHVLAGGEIDGSERARYEARLRKRFQLLKQRLLVG